MASKNECIIEGRLGQDPKVGIKWTNEEQLLLCQMIENKKTNVYIAKILGRSYGSVCHKIYQLGKAREKGVNQTFFGIPYSMQGKHHTDDTKLKIGRKARERLKDKNRNPHWKGGRVVSNNGYMTIYFPDHPRAGQNKHVFEHIVIMETILQRQLEIEECVHTLTEIDWIIVQKILCFLKLILITKNITHFSNKRSGKNMNKIILTGRLVRNCEIRTTQSGKMTTSFTLAVDRFGGGKENNADFISIVTWEKLAEICGNNLDKGRKCLVEGRLQIRNFEGKDGVKRWVTEVVAQNVEFLDKKVVAPPVASGEGAEQFGQEVQY